jgi:hypothetical protein
MDEDVANATIVDNWLEDEPQSRVVKYCRACELACPVASNQEYMELGAH